MKKPELLMPAGSLQKQKYAYAYGADAVYAGVPFFSLRARENEFSLEDLKEGIQLAKDTGKKLYVTANIFARNRKINQFFEQIDQWAELKPDALIMSDPGLMLIVRERHPDLAIHLSVQANCMNWQSVRFWHETAGVERVILSRELNLNEIREIKQRVPTVELEAFVHGAICIAYSGRCMMSSYFSYRDANQGVCDNSCREKFNVYAADKEEQDYYIEDLRDKGKFYQINEDENGTYLMNAKDLCLIEYLREIAEAGVESFKVEGRTKSIYYASLVSRAYRKAIDDMIDGKEFNKDLLKELAKVANRGYDTGFMIPGLNKQKQNYDTSLSRYYSQRFAGLIKPESDVEGYTAVEIRNKVEVGQEAELILPDGKSRYLKIEAMLNSKKQPIESAHGGAGLAYIRTGESLGSEYGILSLKQTDREIQVQTEASQTAKAARAAELEAAVQARAAKAAAAKAQASGAGSQQLQ